jgi:hypothetical protein
MRVGWKGYTAPEPRHRAVDRVKLSRCHPKSTGSENIGLERADFSSVGMGEVGSLVSTTLEFNEKSGHVNRRRASWDVRLAE